MRTVRHGLVLGSMIGLAACGTQYASLRERAAAEGMCNDARAQRLVGQQATADAGQRILELTGARFFEWIAPGIIVATGFSPWRIRVTYDQSFTITEIRCG